MRTELSLICHRDRHPMAPTSICRPSKLFLGGLSWATTESELALLYIDAQALDGALEL